MAEQSGLCLAIALMALLNGCSTSPSELERLEAKVERRLEAAKDCVRDTMYVAFEDSGNCLAELRLAREQALSELCQNDEGLHCRRLNEKSAFAYSLIWQAIAASLWAHGKPKEFDPAQVSDKFGYSQFRDLDVMEKAFASCLAEEAAARSKLKLGLSVYVESGMAVRTSTIVSPLQEGQKCIREGYAKPFQEGQT